jgi:hypothetical protein
MSEFISIITSYDYSTIVFWWKFVAAILSLAFIYGIIYSMWSTNIILKKRDVFLAPSSEILTKRKSVENWEKIVARGNSDNDNERKMAIIAADSLIEKILELAGYSGENLGEKLKNIERSDLNSLNILWEAHKVRNSIAHEGDFKLSKDESSRVITLYGRALRELKYI